MIIDAEVHLLPPGLAAGTDEPALREKIYDHPDGARAVRLATVEALLDSMARCGIDRAVIMGLPWRSPARCRENNEYLARACRAHPGTFIGFTVVNPAVAGWDDEVRRCARDLGFRGVKVIASWQGWSLDDAVADRLAELLVAEGLALLPHIDYLYTGSAAESPAHLYRLAARHPGLKILAPHLGGLLCLHEAYAPVRENLRNVRYLTSVPLTMAMVAAAARCCGDEKLVFGTDYPFQPNHDQESVLADFNALGLTAPLRGRILAANLLDFLGMSE